MAGGEDRSRRQQYDCVVERHKVGDCPKLVWSAYNSGDGDHQLYVNVTLLQQNVRVVVEYFGYVVPLLHFVVIRPQYKCVG